MNLAEFCSSLGISLDAADRCISTGSFTTCHPAKHFSRLIADMTACLSVKRQSHAMDFVCANPPVLSREVRHQDRVIANIGMWMQRDEDFVSALTPKLLQHLCRPPASEADATVREFAKFFQLAVTFNPQVRKRMSGWIMHYYPSINDALRPSIIAVLPQFLAKVDPVEDALMRNVRDGGRDLMTASLATLIAFQSPRLQEESPVELDAWPPELIAKALKSYPLNDFVRQLIRSLRKRLVSLYTETAFVPPGRTAKRTRTAGHGTRDPLELIDCLGEAVCADPASLLKCWLEEGWLGSGTHPVDLLALFVAASSLSGRETDKTHAAALNAIAEAAPVHESALNEVFTTLLPRALERLSWLREGLPTLLMQTMTQVLALSNDALVSRTCLAISRIFLTNGFGDQVRKMFIGFVAGHVLDGTDEHVAERCMHLIEAFIEAFPDVRFICFSLIKTLLDGVDSWGPRLLRRYYTAYATMARNSDSVMNEFVILVKKQLYSSDPQYRRIGALGCGVFVEVIGRGESVRRQADALLPDPDEMGDEFALDALPSCSQRVNPAGLLTDADPQAGYFMRLVLSMLEEAVKVLRLDPAAFAVFLSHLCRSVDTLAAVLQEWLQDWVSSVFQSNFVQDSATATDATLLFDLGDEENPVCVCFGPVIAQRDPASAGIVSCGPLLFRLMQRCEKTLNGGDLGAIDALQSCPIVETTLTSPGESFLQTHQILTFFHEVVNAFQDQNTPAAQRKNLQRLSAIQVLQTSLLQTLKKKPHGLLQLKVFSECRQLIYRPPSNAGQLAAGVSEEDDDPFLRTLLPDIMNEKKLAPLQTTDSLMDLNEQTLAQSLPPLSLAVVTSAVSAESDPELVMFLLRQLPPLDETEESPLELCLALGDYWRRNEVSIEAPFVRILADLVASTSKRNERDGTLQEQICATYADRCRRLLARKNASIELRASVFLLTRAMRTVEPFPDAEGLLQSIIKSHPDMKPPTLLEDLLTEVLVRLDQNVLCDRMMEYCEMYFSLDGDSVKTAALNNRFRCFLYRALCVQIGRQLRAGQMNAESGTRLIVCWGQLIQFARAAGSPAWLAIVVKDSRVVIEALLHSPLLAAIESSSALLVDADKNAVLSLLKALQQCTRSLQIICNHLKYMKGGNKAAISSSIPYLKRDMERLIFRIKELVGRSGCIGAFWMGNLKHRALDGQELSSQVALLTVQEDSPEDAAAISKEFVNTSDLETDDSPAIDLDLTIECKDESLLNLMLPDDGI